MKALLKLRETSRLQYISLKHGKRLGDEQLHPNYIHQCLQDPAKCGFVNLMGDSIMLHDKQASKRRRRSKVASALGALDCRCH
jgi:hypothetical protein